MCVKSNGYKFEMVHHISYVYGSSRIPNWFVICLLLYGNSDSACQYRVVPFRLQSAATLPICSARYRRAYWRFFEPTSYLNTGWPLYLLSYSLIWLPCKCFLFFRTVGWWSRRSIEIPASHSGSLQLYLKLQCAIFLAPLCQKLQAWLLPVYAHPTHQRL